MHPSTHRGWDFFISENEAQDGGGCYVGCCDLRAFFLEMSRDGRRRPYGSMTRFGNRIGSTAEEDEQEAADL